MRKSRVFIAIAIMMLLFGCSNAPDTNPDSNQIKKDLIGQRIGNIFSSWKFESLAEFQEFTISSKNHQGDTIAYDVSMLLKGVNSDKKYHAECLIVYKKVNEAWKLVSISKKLLEAVR